MNLDGGGAQLAVGVESGWSGAQFNAIMPPSTTATMTKMTNMPVIFYGWPTLRIDRRGRPDISLTELRSVNIDLLDPPARASAANPSENVRSRQRFDLRRYCLADR
jgi:hypothetical protein